MPTYDYACPNCGIVEVFQSIKEDALKKCPRCKKAKVQRMVSAGSGVIFKGSGFWETDYNRSGDYRAKSKGEQDAKSGAAKTGDAKPGSDQPKKAGDEQQKGKKPESAGEPPAQPKPQLKKADPAPATTTR
jgi:putative FmdB family regulatory protein